MVDFIKSAPTIQFAASTYYTGVAKNQPTQNMKTNPQVRNMHSLQKNIIIPNRATFWMTALTSILGIYLALISRFRLSPELNILFERTDKDLQSIAEHFLTSTAVPAAFIAFIIAIKRLSKGYKHEKSRLKISAYTLTRRWLIRNIKFSRAFEWSIIFAELYILASLSWEIGQASEHRAFQWDQFSADIMGAAIFLAALLFISRRRNHYRVRMDLGAL